MRLSDVAERVAGRRRLRLRSRLRRQEGGLHRHQRRPCGEPARRDRRRAQGVARYPTRSCRGACRARSSTIRPVREQRDQRSHRTLAEALIIVTLVVFVFLGSVRSVLIPAVAIPLSLVGTFTVMFALGYSINLLTLLALVLAIGLVVDDAIIVVENVNRHLEEGMPRMQAAIRAARELANPIIAMTIVLVAVYVPIGFLGGLDRGAVHRIRRSRWWARSRVGHHRADPVADDVLAPPESAGPAEPALAGPAGAVPRSQLRAPAQRLRADAARHAELPAGHGGDVGHHPRIASTICTRPPRPSSRRRKTRAC